MKASSCGLEVKVKLDGNELTRLKLIPILGHLLFREIKGSYSKKINMTINYNPPQKEFVNVLISPSKTYFGDSKRVDFFINEEFYNSLVEKNSAIERFGMLGNGKLEVTIF